MNDRTQKLFDEPRMLSNTLSEFKDRVIDVANKATASHSKILGVFFERTRFNREVSNSHSSPIGKRNNWAARNEDYPSSFPGWISYIVIITSSDNRDSDFVKGVPGINTGTGGGGYYGEHEGIKGYISKYDLKLFLSDFPLIQEKYKRTMGLLSSKNYG